MFSINKLILPILLASPLLAMQAPEIAQQFDMSAVPAEIACKIATQLAQAETPEKAVRNLKALACTNHYFAGLLKDKAFIKNYLQEMARFFDMPLVAAIDYLNNENTKVNLEDELNKIAQEIQKRLESESPILALKSHLDFYTKSVILVAFHNGSILLARISTNQNKIDQNFAKCNDSDRSVSLKDGILLMAHPTAQNFDFLRTAIFNHIHQKDIAIRINAVFFNGQDQRVKLRFTIESNGRWHSRTIEYN